MFPDVDMTVVVSIVPLCIEYYLSVVYMVVFIWYGIFLKKGLISSNPFNNLFLYHSRLQERRGTELFWATRSVGGRPLKKERGRLPKLVRRAEPVRTQRARPYGVWRPPRGTGSPLGLITLLVRGLCRPRITDILWNHVSIFLYY